MIFKNTRTMISNMLNDINRIIYWTTIVVQIFFLGFYGYSIYNNVDFLPLIITYSVVCVLSIISFIHFIVTFNNKSDSSVKSTKKVFRLSKLSVNGVMIIVKIVELILFYANMVDILLVSLSGILFLFQVILELIKKFFVDYIELIKTGFEMDVAPVVNAVNSIKNIGNKVEETVGKVKGKVLEIIDAPISGIAKIVSHGDENEVEVQPEIEKLGKKQIKAAKRHQKNVEYIESKAVIFEKEVLAKKRS